MPKRRERVRPALLALLAGALAVAVLLLPLAVTYRPVVSAAPGHVVHVPTQPSRIGGVAKAFHARFDGTPCAYSVLEWGEDGTLYYQSLCANSLLYSVWGPDGDGSQPSKRAERRVWAFNPDDGAQAHSVDATPNALVDTPRRVGYAYAHSAPGAVPAEPGSTFNATRPMPSQDGRWFAVVVSRYYEPQDLVVVSR